MAYAIALANQKGGVGKTTGTVELSTILCELGKKVLAIDLDQQCNLTKNSKLPEGMKIGDTIYELFTDDAIKVQDVIKTTEAGYDLLPGSPKMSKADKDFSDTPDTYLLSDLLDSLSEEYDYFLIDNAPARNTLLNMSYLAADYFIMCADSGEDSLDGIDSIATDMMKFHKAGKRALSNAKILGVIITRYRKTNISDAIIEITEENMAENIPEVIKTEEKPFVMTVRETSKVDEAKMMHQPLQKYKRSATAAIDYREIADEIIRRVEG